MKKFLISLALLCSFAFTSGAQRITFDWLRSMYFGFSTFTQTNYYGNWADTSCPDFLDQRAGQSFSFAFDAFAFNISLDHKRNWELMAGLRFTFGDHVFRNPGYTLVDVNGQPWPAVTPASTSKSKIHTDYVGIPLDIRFNVGKFSLFAGASAEILLNANCKYKQPSTRYVISGVNPFRSVAEVGMTYNHIGIFAQYSLTPVFKPGTGSDARELKFGFLLGL